MFDHLIMTRPSGNGARLLFFHLSFCVVYADNTILPQCPSTQQIHNCELALMVAMRVTQV